MLQNIIILSSFIVSIFLLIQIPESSSYTNHYDDVMNNQNIQLWSVGNNLQAGNYFHYTICNDDTMSQEIWPYHCYNIELEFVEILESYMGKTWIVQGYLTIHNSTKPMILFVDPDTFEVSTDRMNINLGNSLEKTIFSLSKYGEKSLSIGTVWDNIDSYFTNKIPLEIKDKQSFVLYDGTEIETSVLSYDIIVSSETYLSYDFPFPLKSELFSSQIIFPEPKELSYYKLVNFHTELTGGN